MFVVRDGAARAAGEWPQAEEGSHQRTLREHKEQQGAIVESVEREHHGRNDCSSVSERERKRE